jgi:hypothetical protein
MIAGLCNLDTLKKHLLPSSMAPETRFDLPIQLIGAGVRGAFEQYCNRKFVYTVDDTQDFTGNRSHYYLPRYPLSGVTKIEMRYFQTDDWTEITDQPITISYENGLVAFGYTLGREPLRVRATWSGGYWFEPLEPDDDAYPSTKPEVTDELALRNGAQIPNLPDELLSAFLWQCEAVWATRDKLGIGLNDKPDQQSGLSKLELVPMAKGILNQFIRYQLS